jgi:hypothetical protein
MPTINRTYLILLQLRLSTILTPKFVKDYITIHWEKNHQNTQQLLFLY